MFPAQHIARGTETHRTGAWALVRAAGLRAVLAMVNDVLDVVLDIRDYVTTLVEETVASTMTVLIMTGVLGHRRGFRD